MQCLEIFFLQIMEHYGNFSSMYLEYAFPLNAANSLNHCQMFVAGWGNSREGCFYSFFTIFN